MYGLIAVGILMAVLVLTTFITIAVLGICDRVKTKRWAKAKASDGYLRLLIECAIASRHRYDSAWDAVRKCKDAIDALRKGNEYLPRAVVAERLEMADNLCAKCQELEANAKELRHISSTAQREFETYCEEKNYKPWG